MWTALTLIEENLAMSFENIILLVCVLGSVIFSAKDFKLMLVEGMSMTGLLFVWFYESGMFYSNALIVFFIYLVLLVMSLYPVNKTSTTGGFSG